ncbi:pseudouridine synthase, partial [Pseudomonas gingeri]|nr:pseudouridine synthase [Pseudomonas gingeri]
LEQDLPLPNASGILEMAEMVYADRPLESLGLRTALKKFDQLIVNAR